MKRIHIVGVSSRTGTTLLAECMRLCFKLDAHEEHESSLRKMRWVDGLYLTKRPHDIVYCGLRLVLDPRLYVICMVRDPRDVIVSRHSKCPDQYWTDLGPWKYRMQLLAKWKNHSRMIVVKYEDLIEHPDQVQTYIQSKLPFLKSTNSFSNFHEAGSISRDSSLALNGVRAIDRSNSRKWTAELPRIAEQLERHGDISEELIEWGYERDSSWLKPLGITVQQRKPSSADDKSYTRRNYYVRYPSKAIIASLCYLLSINYG